MLSVSLSYCHFLCLSLSFPLSPQTPSPHLIHFPLYMYIHLTHACPLPLAHCIMHSLFSWAVLRAASAVRQLWSLQRLEWLKPGKNKPLPSGGAWEIETAVLPSPLLSLMISTLLSITSCSYPCSLPTRDQGPTDAWYQKKLKQMVWSWCLWTLLLDWHPLCMTHLCSFSSAISVGL